MPLVEPIPNVRSLDLLRSVAEFGSIRQAAIAHGISQPAASTRLRSLEHNLRLQLLDRSRGNARLTSAGEALVQWSGPVLKEMQDLLASVAASRVVERSHLRIAASMTVAEYLAPAWLNRLRDTDPTAIVSLQMGNSEYVAEVVRQRRADIGFIEGRLAPVEFNSRVIRSDDLVVVVSPAHPWAHCQGPLTVALLASTPLVLRESGSGTREVFEAALSSFDLSASPLVELGSTTAIKAAIASGAGPGVLSRLAVHEDLAVNRLVAVPFEGFSLERSIRAIWVQNHLPSNHVLQLLRLIEDLNE